MLRSKFALRTQPDFCIERPAALVGMRGKKGILIMLDFSIREEVNGLISVYVDWHRFQRISES